jgi:uncharacterized integral membrane protein
MQLFAKNAREWCCCIGSILLVLVLIVLIMMTADHQLQPTGGAAMA